MHGRDVLLMLFLFSTPVVQAAQHESFDDYKISDETVFAGLQYEREMMQVCVKLNQIINQFSTLSLNLTAFVGPHEKK